ncbi:MAG TPA: hypothetical protein VF927_05730 [Solirubrobacteraceae bacterium]
MACLVWFAVSGRTPAWVDAGVIAALLFALLFWEQRHDPAEHSA